MFSHKTPDAIAPFVQITTASGHVLTLTADHYLHVNGALAASKTVTVGDMVRLHNGSEVSNVWLCISA